MSFTLERTFARAGNDANGLHKVVGPSSGLSPSQNYVYVDIFHVEHSGTLGAEARNTCMELHLQVNFVLPKFVLLPSQVMTNLCAGNFPAGPAAPVKGHCSSTAHSGSGHSHCCLLYNSSFVSVSAQTNFFSPDQEFQTRQGQPAN